MSGQNVTPIFSALPANATNEQGLLWIERIRRALARWEELPADQTHMMTLEVVEQAIGELNHLEWLICSKMNESRHAWLISATAGLLSSIAPENAVANRFLQSPESTNADALLADKNSPPDGAFIGPVLDGSAIAPFLRASRLG